MYSYFAKRRKDKTMEPIDFKKIEEKAVSLFGEEIVVSLAKIRVANKGYMVRVSVQGLPFEVTATAKNLEFALEQATYEYGKRMHKVCANDLFKTQPNERYEKVQLSKEELDKLYRFEEYLSGEYLKEIKEKTIAWVTQLKEKMYECVVESPYKNLHSRGVGSSKQTAIMSALWKAHEIFEPELIRVGQDIMK